MGLKEARNEPSSPLRHCTELANVLNSQVDFATPIVLLYSDGGPDHRITYLTTKIALICLFLRCTFSQRFELHVSVLEKSSRTNHVDIESSTPGSGVNEEGNACSI